MDETTPNDPAPAATTRRTRYSKTDAAREHLGIAPDTASAPRASRGETPQEAEAARTFAIEAAQLASDLHCEGMLVLDVRGLSTLTNFIVIGSGTSDRQIRAVGDNIEDLAGQHDLRRFGREADASTNWLVLDFVDVIIHLFEPATRSHYDLEMLWGDAPRLAWERAKRA